jgi:hypothetical protein
MKIEVKQKLKNLLEKRLKRSASSNELVNMETDSLLLAQMLEEWVDELEQRIDILERKP